MHVMENMRITEHARHVSHGTYSLWDTTMHHIVMSTLAACTVFTENNSRILNNPKFWSQEPVHNPLPAYSMALHHGLIII